MSRIRVLLADDHAVLRDSLAAFLGLYPDIEVVGQAADGVETLAQIAALHPDVVLLDLNMPGLGGLEVLRRAGKEHPECRVVVLTQYDAPQYILPALQAGARGYLLKKAGGAEVVNTVRAVMRGESVLHPAVTQFVIEAAVQAAGDAQTIEARTALTDREREVLRLIGEGLTNAQIAAALRISPKTVDKHRANIMEKLHITTRAALIRYALDNR
jgi:two-component system response regulator NreC